MSQMKFDDNFIADFTKVNSNSPGYYNSGTNFRFYSTDYFTIKPINDGIVITKVIINHTNSYNKGYALTKYIEDGESKTASSSQQSSSGNTLTIDFGCQITECTITASGSNRISDITIEYTTLVEDTRTPVTLAWDAESASITLGDTFEAPTLTVNPEIALAEVVYTSSDESVAKFVDGSLTILAVGKTTIKAEISSSETYKNAYAEYELNVTRAVAPGEKTETLTISDFKASGSAYTEYTYTSEITGISYKATVSVNGSNFTFNTNNSNLGKNSGIVTTANPNGYILKAVSIVGANAALNVGFYGNTADYTATTPNTSNGTLIASHAGASEMEETAVNGTYSAVALWPKVGGSMQFSSVTFIWEKADPDAVAAPTFTVEVNKISIACETEGAEIHFTTDGTTATADSPVYDGTPIEVYEPTSFSAIAVKDGKESREGKFTTNFFVLEDFSMLSEITEEYLSYDFVFTCPMTVLYEGSAKRRMYVRSGYQNMFIFSRSDMAAYNPGDVINGATGKFEIYNGLLEFIPTTLGEVTGTANVPEPTVIEFADMQQNMINEYVRLVDVTITAGSNNNFTLTNAADETVACYNGNAITVPTDGKKYDVIGFVGIYSKNNETTIQMTPTEFINYSAEASIEADPVEYVKDGKVIGNANWLKLTTPTIAANGQPVATEGFEIYLNDTKVGTVGDAVEGFAFENDKDNVFTVRDGEHVIPVAVAGKTLDSEAAIQGAEYLVEADGVTTHVAFYVAPKTDNGLYYTVKSEDADDVYWRHHDTYTGAACHFYNVHQAAAPATFEAWISYPIAVNKTAAPAAAKLMAEGDAVESPYDFVEFDAPHTTLDTTADELQKNDSNTSGVADVAVDQEGEVEFFNLQGVRVIGELTPGLYIRRQGNRATKVVVK